MSLTTEIDLLLAILLIICIGAMAVLNRRLSALRHDRADLERLTESFGEATGRADQGIAGLKAVASSLDDKIAQARTLIDDLEFLMDRGAPLADRLENAVRHARAVSETPRPAASKRSTPVARDDAEEMLRATGAAGLSSGASVAVAGLSQRSKQRSQLTEHQSAAERHLAAALRARS